MSVVVRGMKMPKDCFTCPFMYRKRPQPEVWCTANEDKWIDIRNVHGDARHELCPLAELPPHGRLIDVDALPQGRVEWEDIVDAPTIIEEEEVQDGTL